MSTVMPAEQPDPEVALADAIASGDRKRALRMLMERFGEDVRRSAMTRVGDDSVAEDVRQQVFLEAYRDLGQLSAAAAARAWLLGITRHRSLDAVKKRARWWRIFKSAPAEPADNDPEPGPVDVDADPIGALDRVGMAKILKRCMAHLAPAAREAVALCYGQELSHQEVAAIVGDRVGAVQKRISRAFVALRTCVERRMSGGAQ